jgi:apolipoprotein D and lipocalin family protein
VLYLRQILLASAVLLLGCSSNRPPIDTVSRVDLQRFMGDWFVIAAIPTFIERQAHNAIESYRLADDGTVSTSFTFRDGGFDGPLRRYTPTGYVRDDSAAVWGMQFIWPIRAEYRVAYLDPAYQETIIGRTARDYVWIMARSPSIGEAEYQRLVEKVRALGYDTNQLRRVPQHWP